jgi:hypothetical protein
VAAEAFDSWSERQFMFLRSDGTVASWTAPKVLDTAALSYEYDTIERPVFNPVPPLPAGGGIDGFGVDRLDFTPLAAASGIDLAAARTIMLTGGGDDDGSVGVDPDQRWNVRCDSIRSEQPALTPYAVYLDLDDEQDPDDSRLLGALSLFGVFESSLEPNGDLGSSHLLEATAVVRRLPGFDRLAARVTVIPTRDDRDLDAMGPHC